MTVKELIKLLKEFDPNAMVCSTNTYCCGCGAAEITKVRTESKAFSKDEHFIMIEAGHEH